MLLPKKAKELIKQTAISTDTDEVLVADLVSFFYKNVRNSLIELKSPIVLVPNLGSFTIKPWKVDEFIIDCERQLGLVRPNTMQSYATKKDLEKKLILLKNMKQMIDEQGIKKQTVKEKRYGKGTS